jgi:iron(III) transport system permease protein
MNRWRLVLAGVLVLVVAAPLAIPFLDLFVHTEAWAAWREADRIAALARTTFLLIIAVVALTLPAGTAAAVLLYRSDLPGRRWLRALIVVALFVPLPLFASAWQAALGSGGWLPLDLWRTVAPDDPDFSPTGVTWKPWARGLAAAAWVHAIAALPWVVWLVGQGLCWVEPELEEDARLSVGPWRVLWRVTLPRAGAAVGAAALWVAVQAATEITVTDMMQVRTFAEEVYTQAATPEAPDLLARAVAVSLPGAAATVLLVLAAARLAGRSLPPLRTSARPTPLVRLGLWRWPVAALVAAAVAVLAGIPVGSLVWKAGQGGSPPAWSASVTEDYLRLAYAAHRGLIAADLAGAAATGVVTAAVALLACWLARGSGWFYAAALGLAALAWALPGPVVGLGLKDWIARLMAAEDTVGGPGWLAGALYQGPSLLPALWAAGLRTFPYALALLWPAVRLLPVELTEAARADGATPFWELRHSVWPLAAPAYGRAALAVTVLALGELSAGKLVATPGGETFAHEVFKRMHYGVTNHLAALCLVLLMMVAVPGAVLAAWGGARRERR